MIKHRESKFSGCTIAARNYLAQANILARTFKEHHPDAPFVILVVDQLGAGRARDDGVELATLDDIGLDPGESHRMPLIYDVTELSTAVKPWLLQSLLRAGAEVAIYFDPDIEIFAALDDVAELARKHSIVLTPHVTEPMPRDRLQLSESDILSSGIYNLGFIAVGPGSGEFLAWWAIRLRRESVIDPTRMRFTDQRWIDFVPGLFPHFILRDTACNVAYWNLYSRELVWRGDHYEVDGRPLRFFHFSGYDPDKPHLLSKHQGNRPRVLLSDRPALAQICDAYREQLLAGGFVANRSAGYGFDALPCGVKIDQHIRRLYREALVEFEEGRAEEPPDPFAPDSGVKFVSWLNAAINSGSPVVTRYMLAIHARRADLQSNFPQPLGRDAAAFHTWFLKQGRVEEKVPDLLVPSEKASGLDLKAGDPRQDLIAVPKAGDPRVTVVGYLRAELGVGEAARLILAGLEASGTPFETLIQRDTISRQDYPFHETTAEVGHSDINIVCINADQTPLFAAQRGQEFYRGRYTIGVWFWEVEEFPDSLRDAFKYVDEIWVASEFTRAALLKVSPRPVFKFPLPVIQPLVDHSLSRQALGLPERFTFLFNFDFLSVFERKNPLGLINAFSRAFRPGEGPTLLIKSINGEKCFSDLECLRRAASGHTDIQIVDGYVTAIEKNTLMSHCDCYISLHRSEGYGLTLAEAMALSRPVIATGYSGNCEFMTADNSYLCSYQLGPVGPGHDPYPAQARWADPDIDMAAALMRRVYTHRDEARTRGVRAAKEVLDRFSPAAAGRIIRQRIDQIRSFHVPEVGAAKDSFNRDSSSINAQLDQVGHALDQLRESVLFRAKSADTLSPNEKAPGRAHRLTSASDDAINPAIWLSFASAKEKLDSVRALHRYVQQGAENLRGQLEQAERQLWEHKVKRADATARGKDFEERLHRIEKSGLWKFMRPFWRTLARASKHNSRNAADIVFELEQPPTWNLESSRVVLAGWCFSRSGREIAGVRVKINRKGRFARYGIERQDVWRSHEHVAQARLCGFHSELSLPSGQCRIVVEAIVQGESWRPFFETVATVEEKHTPEKLHRVGIEPTTR